MIRREPPPSRGQVIRSEFLRGLDQRLRQLEARPGVKPIRPEPGPEPDAPAASGSGSPVEVFVLTGENANTWVCTRVATGATGVLVAKPPALRGAVGTRTISGEDQVIAPNYTFGVTNLYAIGFTESGLGTEWLDLNVDARAWTMVYIGP